MSEDIRAIEDQCCEAGSEREVRLSGVIQLQQKAKWYQALKYVGHLALHSPFMIFSV